MYSLTFCRAAVAGLFLCLTAGLPAQVFRLTGGASTSYQAQGAGIEVKGKGYEGWTGAGVLDGKIIFGSYVKMGLRGYVLKLGSDYLPMRLPIDIFGTQSTLYTNGVSVDNKLKGTSYHVFAGQMGTTFSSPMFSAGTSSGPLVGIVYADRLIAPDLHIFTKNILTTARTSISGIEWDPCSISSSRLAGVPLLRDLKAGKPYGCIFSFAAGIGSGHSYTSETLSLTQPRLNLKLGYVSAADGFQRTISSTLQSELGGANVTGDIRPTGSLDLAFGYQNYLIPQPGSLPTLHVQVDRLSGGWKRRDSNGPAIGSSFFRSVVLDRTTSGASLWASQSAGPIDLRFNYLASVASGSNAVQSLSLTTQEKLSPRISVLQVTGYSGGNTSVVFGGSLLTNLMTVSVNYQTLYVPLRPDKPFTQAMAISLNFNLRGNVRLSTATSFTPQGKMYYTLAGAGSYYRMAGLEAAPPMQSFRMQQYLIQGFVSDSEGHPVSGAAIRIGKETFYTDHDGHFFARERKAGHYKVEVDLSAFVADGNFAVLSAPDDAVASKDESAPGIVIVLTRH